MATLTHSNYYVLVALVVVLLTLIPQEGNFTGLGCTMLSPNLLFFIFLMQDLSLDHCVCWSFYRLLARGSSRVCACGCMEASKRTSAV